MSTSKPSRDDTAGATTTAPPAAGLTRAQAGRAYLHYARLTELHAYRYAEASSSRRYTAAARSQRKYRQAARACRLIGELMRGNASSVRSVDDREPKPAAQPAAEPANAAREIMRQPRAA
jgi:hypothetical protein